MTIKKDIYLFYAEKSEGRDPRLSHSVWDPGSLYIYI